MAGAVRRIFQSKAPKLMWPAQQSYVLPIIMYGSPGWNALVDRNCKLIENIHRWLTKNVVARSTSAVQRRTPEDDGALNLEQRRLYADIATVYKTTYVLLGCSLAELGLQIVSSTTRCAEIRLAQRRARSKFRIELFYVRAPVQWNSLPLGKSGCNSLSIWKDRLFNYLLAQLREHF